MAEELDKLLIKVDSELGDLSGIDKAIDALGKMRDFGSGADKGVKQLEAMGRALQQFNGLGKKLRGLDDVTGGINSMIDSLNSLAKYTGKAHNSIQQLSRMGEALQKFGGLGKSLAGLDEASKGIGKMIGVLDRLSKVEKDASNGIKQIGALGDALHKFDGIVQSMKGMENVVQSLEQLSKVVDKFKGNKGTDFDFIGQIANGFAAFNKTDSAYKSIAMATSSMAKLIAVLKDGKEVKAGTVSDIAKEFEGFNKVKDLKTITENIKTFTEALKLLDSAADSSTRAARDITYAFDMALSGIDTIALKIPGIAEQFNNAGKMLRNSGLLHELEQFKSLNDSYQNSANFIGGIANLINVLQRGVNIKPEALYDTVAEIEAIANGDFSGAKENIEMLGEFADAFGRLINAMKFARIDDKDNPLITIAGQLKQFESIHANLQGFSYTLYGLRDLINLLDESIDKKISIDTTPLVELFKAFEEADGKNIASAGTGIKSIASALEKLQKVNADKISAIAPAIREITSSIGNIGNNNTLKITISGDGVAKVKQVVKDISATWDEFKQKTEDKVASIDFSKNFTFGETRRELEKQVVELERSLKKQERLMREAQDKMDKVKIFAKDDSRPFLPPEAFEEIKQYQAEIDALQEKYSELSPKLEANETEFTFGGRAQGILEAERQQLEKDEQLILNSLKDTKSKIEDILKTYNLGEFTNNLDFSKLEEFTTKIAESYKDNKKYRTAFYDFQIASEYAKQYKGLIEQIKAQLVTMPNISVKTDVEGMQQLDKLESEYQKYNDILTRLQSEEGEGRGDWAADYELVEEHLNNILADMEGVREQFEQLERSAEGVAYQASKIADEMNRAAEESRKAAKELATKTGKGFSSFGNLLKGSNNEIFKAFGDVFGELGSKVGGMDGVSEEMASISSGLGQFAEKAGYVKLVIGVLKAVRSEMDKLTNTLKNAVISAIQFAKTMLSRVVGAFNAVAGAVKKTVSAVHSGTQLMASAVRKLGDAVKSVADQFSKLGTAVKSISAAIGKSFLKLVPNILKNSEKSLSSIIKKTAILGPIVKKIGGIFKKLDNMIIRKALTAFLNGLKQAFNDMAVYSSKMGTKFNENISKIFSALRRSANQWIAAFEPLINAVTPMVLNLLETFRTFGENVAKFMAILTGQSYYLRAKPFYEDYAAGLDKASKSAKNLTNSLDELNILNESKSDDDGIKPEDMWEKVAVDGKLPQLEIRDILEQIKDFLKNIDWDKIKEKVRAGVKRLFDIINEILRDKELWYLLGKTLAEMINTLFTALNEAVHQWDPEALAGAITSFLHGVLENIDWDLIRDTFAVGAQKLAETLNLIFADKKLWEEIGDAIAHVINDVVLTALANFAWKFDGKLFAEAILLAIKTALEEIRWDWVEEVVRLWAEDIADIINTVFGDEQFWTDLGNFIANAINSIFLGLDEIGKRIEFEKIGEALAIGINNILAGFNWDLIRSAVKTWAEGLADVINGIVNDPSLFANIGTTIGNIINTVINDGIRAFVLKIDAAALGQRIAEAFKNAFNSIEWDEILQLPGDVINKLTDVLSGIVDNINLKNVGKKLTKAIRKGLKNIKWENIKKTLSTIAQQLGDLINEFLADNDFWKEIGAAIGEAANLLIKVPVDIIWNINWDQAGTALANELNELIKKIDFGDIGTKLGQTISKMLNGIINFFEKFDAKDFGKRIGQAIANIFKEFSAKDIRSAIWHFFDGISKFIDGLLEELNNTETFEQLGYKLGGIIQGVITGIAHFFNENGDAIKTAIDQFSDGILRYLEEHEDEIIASLNIIIDKICDIIRDFFNNKSRLIKEISDILGELDLGNIFGTIIGGLISNFFDKTNINFAVIEGILSNLGDLVVSIFESIKPHLIDIILSALGKVFGGMAGKAIGEAIGAKIGGLLGSALGPIGTAIGAALGSLVGLIISHIDFGKLAEDLANIGKWIAEGILNGLNSIGNFFSKLVDWATGIFDSIVGTLKKLFRIASPSKTMEEIGGWIGEGLFNGLSGWIEKLAGLASKIFDTLMGVLNGILDAVKGIGDLLGGALSGIGGILSGAGNGLANLGQKVGDFLSGKKESTSIADAIKEDWDNAQKYIEENPMDIDTSKFSKMLAENLVKAMMEAIQNMLKNLDYDKIAKKVSEIIDAVIAKVDWKKISDNIVSSLFAALDTAKMASELETIIGTVIESLNWEGIAENMIDKLLSAIDPEKITGYVDDLVKLVIDNINAVKTSAIEDSIREDMENARKYIEEHPLNADTSSVVQQMADAFVEAFKSVIGGLDDLTEDALADIKKVINEWTSTNSNIFDPLGQSFKNAIRDIKNDAREYFRQVEDVFSSRVERLNKHLEKIGKDIDFAELKHSLERIPAIVDESLSGIGDGLADTITQKLKDALTIPESDVMDIVANMKYADAIEAAYTQMLQDIDEKTGWWMPSILGQWEKSINKIAGMFKSLSSAWERMFKDMRNYVKKGMRLIYKTFQEWINKINDLLKSVKNTWEAQLKLSAIVEAELDKVYEQFNELLEKLKPLFNRLATVWRNTMRKFPQYAKKYLAETYKQFEKYIDMIKQLIATIPVSDVFRLLVDEWEETMKKFPEITNKYLEKVCSTFNLHIKHMKAKMDELLAKWADIFERFPEVVDKGLKDATDKASKDVNDLNKVLDDAGASWKKTWEDIAKTTGTATAELDKAKEATKEMSDSWDHILDTIKTVAEKFKELTGSINIPENINIEGASNITESIDKLDGKLDKLIEALGKLNLDNAGSNNGTCNCKSLTADEVTTAIEKAAPKIGEWVAKEIKKNEPIAVKLDSNNAGQNTTASTSNALKNISDLLNIIINEIRSLKTSGSGQASLSFDPTNFDSKQFVESWKEAFRQIKIEADAAAREIKTLFDLESDGFAEGLTDAINNLTNAVDGFSTTLIDAFTKILSALGEIESISNRIKEEWDKILEVVNTVLDKINDMNLSVSYGEVDSSKDNKELKSLDDLIETVGDFCDVLEGPAFDRGSVKAIYHDLVENIEPALATIGNNLVAIYKLLRYLFNGFTGANATVTPSTVTIEGLDDLKKALEEMGAAVAQVGSMIAELTSTIADMDFGGYGDSPIVECDCTSLLPYDITKAIENAAPVIAQWIADKLKDNEDSTTNSQSSTSSANKVDLKDVSEKLDKIIELLSNGVKILGSDDTVDLTGIEEALVRIANQISNLAKMVEQHGTTMPTNYEPLEVPDYSDLLDAIVSATKQLEKATKLLNNTLVSVLSEAENTVGSLVEELDTLISALVDAAGVLDNSTDEIVKTLKTIPEIVTDAANDLKDAASDLSNSIEKMTNALTISVQSLEDVLNNLANKTEHIVQEATKGVASIAESISDVSKNLNEAVNAVRGVITDLQNAIISSRANLDELKDIIDAARSSLETAYETLKDVYAELVIFGKKISSLISDAMDKLNKGVKALEESISKLEDFKKTLKDAAEDFTKAAESLEAAVKKARSLLSELAELLGATMELAAAELKSAADRLVNAMNYVVGGLNSVAESFEKIIEKLGRTMDNLLNDIRQLIYVLEGLDLTGTRDLLTEILNFLKEHVQGHLCSGMGKVKELLKAILDKMGESDNNSSTNNSDSSIDMDRLAGLFDEHCQHLQKAIADATSTIASKLETIIQLLRGLSPSNNDSVVNNNGNGNGGSASADAYAEGGAGGSGGTGGAGGAGGDARVNVDLDPVVKMLKAIADAINNLADKIDKYGSKLSGGSSSTPDLPNVSDLINNLISALKQAIADLANAMELFNKALTLLDEKTRELINTIKPVLETLISQLERATKAFEIAASKLVNAIETLPNKLMQAADQLNSSANALLKAMSSVIEVFSKLIAALTGLNIPEEITITINVTDSLEDVIAKINELKKGLEDIAKSLKKILADAIQKAQLIVQYIEKAINTLKSAISEFKSFVDDLIDTVVNATSTLKDAVNKLESIMASIISNLDGFEKTLVSAISAFKNAVADLKAAINLATSLVSAIGDVIASTISLAAAELRSSADRLINAMSAIKADMDYLYARLFEILERTEKTIREVIPGLIDVFDACADRLETAASKVSSALVDAAYTFNNVAKEMLAAISTIKQVIQWMMNASQTVSSAMNKLKDAAYDLGDKVSKLEQVMANLLKEGIKVNDVTVHVTCNCNCSCCDKNCGSNGSGSGSGSGTGTGTASTGSGSGNGSSSGSSSNTTSSTGTGSGSGGSSNKGDSARTLNDGESWNVSGGGGKIGKATGDLQAGWNDGTPITGGTRATVEQEKATMEEYLQSPDAVTKYQPFRTEIDNPDPNGKDLFSTSSFFEHATEENKNLIANNKAKGQVFWYAFDTGALLDFFKTHGYQGFRVKQLLRETMGEPSMMAGETPMWELSVPKYNNLYNGMLDRVKAKGYEMGGMPNSGELFIARENGTPEMVGSIGSHTAVANNEQIVTAIASGVANANEDLIASVNNASDNIVEAIDRKDTTVKIGDRDIAAANNRGQRQLGRNIMGN